MKPFYHEEVFVIPRVYHCDKCKNFFSRFKCNSPDECDCPVCQGMCECHQFSERSECSTRRLVDKKTPSAEPSQAQTENNL